MKILVFGATGKTGIAIVKQALEKDHEVTAFVRDPGRLPIKHEHLNIIAGNVLDPDTVTQVVQGQDAIVCALGSRDLKKTSIRTDSTENIINAMKANAVQRFVVVSAMGIGESWGTLSLVNKLFFAVFLKSAREDHESQEALVKKSGLDWTIIRPSGRTDTPRTGLYDVGEQISAKTSRISSADVADSILKELEEDNWIRKAVTVTN